MLKKLLNRSKYTTVVFAFILGVFALFNCTGEKQVETVQLNEIIPQSKRDYNYQDSANVQVQKNDPLLDSLKKVLGTNISIASKESVQFKNKWTYIPDRFDVDSSISRSFLLDEDYVVYRSWKYQDSIRTINALYNWLDCFGEQCYVLSIGDSVHVTSGAFLLLSDNTSIEFVQSPTTIKRKDWVDYFNGTKKNTSWNYVLEQKPGGKISWITLPD